MERFFRYSREHAKPIRLLTMPDPETGKMRYLTVIAVRWDTDRLYYIRNSQKAQSLKSMDLSEILAAEYARGDDGDTLKYIMREEEKDNE